MLTSGSLVRERGYFVQNNQAMKLRYWMKSFSTIINDIYHSSDELREDQYRRQHIFISACRVAVIVISIFVVYYGLFDRSYNIIPMAVLLVITAISFFLGKRGKTELAATVTVWSTLIGLFSLAAVNDGLYDTALLAIPALLIVAALLLEKRHLIIYFIIVILLLIATGIFYVSHSEQYPVYTMTSYTDIFDVTVINGATMILVMLISTYLKESLNKIKQSELRLMESEERFRTIFDQSPDAYEVVDRNGQFVEVNSTTMRQLGYSREEMLKMSIFDIDPEITHAQFEQLQSRISSTTSLRFESVHRRRDGSTFPVELSISSIYLNGIKNYITDIRDITERKLAEDAKRESEEKYRGLIEGSPDAIAIYVDGKIVYCNPAGVQLLRASNAEELLGMSVIDLVHSDYKKIVTERMIIMQKEGKTLPIAEEKLIRLDGSTIDVEVKANPIIYEKIPAVQVIVRDITERKRAEAEIKKMALMLSVAPNSVTVHDFNGRFFYANQRTFDLHGYTKDEFMSLNLHELDGPESEKNIAQRMKHLLDNGEARFEVEHFRKDRSIIPMEVYTQLTTWGNERAILSIATDITDRKTLQTQLLQAQKLESIGTLAAGVAHDFNNILNVIIGNSDLLNTSSLDEKNVRRITAIASSAARGAHLVKQLLMFARNTKENYIPLLINDIVEDIAKLISETFPKTINVSLELEIDLPKITVDSNHMHQVLMNVSVNARDAMPSGGTISYCSSLQSGDILRSRFPDVSAKQYVLLMVKDNGMGMDEETLQKIFNPFYTTKEVGKGTGLGMSVVQGIIKSYNGFIDVSSEINVGTKIEIYLPVLDSEKTPVETEKQGTTINLTGYETILLIEDEIFTRNVIEELLVSLGYQIILAGDGEEGVELYKQKKDQIHIVVSDYGLPKINGEEVFRRIKGINPVVRFMVMSGYLDPGTSDRLTKLGVNTIVAKPFKPAELLSKIRETLDQ